jgi:predicted ATP-grasp superfamily ATP-dependent carboligase
MVTARVYAAGTFSGEVLIYEHYSAGGTDPGKNRKSLAHEGLCMAGGLFAHFLESEHAVPRLLLREELFPIISEERKGNVLPTSPGRAEELLLEQCRDGPGVVLIAPETAGLSARLAKEVRAAGGLLLGPDPETIALASDKSRLFAVLSGAGVSCVPQRVVSNFTEAEAAAASTGYPVVTKPLRGTGGTGSALFRSSGELKEFFHFHGEEEVEPMILQPLVEGMPASLSVLAGAGDAFRLISVNRQDIVEEAIEGMGTVTRFHYSGGMTGLSEKEHPHILKTPEKDLERLAEKIKGILGGLFGYSGIDLILTEKGPLILEVNPRMTTPLAILARHVRWNMADALLEACLFGKIPAELPVPVTVFKEEDLAWPISAGN